jgi:hypothetical protein
MKVTIRLLVMGIVAIASTAIQACRSLRPYEKEHLLKPSMDDSRVGSLEPAYAKSAASQFEKLATGSAQGGGGSSCPTCGI